MSKKKAGGQLGNTNAQKWTEESLLKLGNELLEWLKSPKNIFFEKFLIEYDLYGTMLGTYTEKYPSFSQLVNRAKKIQEYKIVEGAIVKDFDSGMTKFMLINNHGYVSDKQQIEQTGKQTIEFVKTIVSKKI